MVGARPGGSIVRNGLASMVSPPKDTRKSPLLFEWDRFLLKRSLSIPFPAGVAVSVESLIGGKLGFRETHSQASRHSSPEVVWPE